MLGAVEQEDVVADWIEILRKQTETGEKMAREVPVILENPHVTEAQVRALFDELDRQAEFVESLRETLEKFDHDFSVIEAAEKLEERFGDLAAAAAEKLKAMRSGG
ncbi:hypothetical protein DES43_10143 [Aquamicrobium defluvii]|uniref:Uncharacterized protein n=1 Tax=Aquamicrobium defluvii TaxID=69279 RepID=A0A4R6YL41_9HYPH|nr:hypothetical protein DES43_10143 [Aquamicrobium defluvii]